VRDVEPASSNGTTNRHEALSRIMRPRLIFPLLAALIVLPVPLPAQPSRPRDSIPDGRSMQQPTAGRRGEGGLEMSDGEPISFVLEHAQSLDLNESQRVGLMNIRRRLRATNSPFMRQLDSLRESMGIILGARPGGLNEEDRRKLQRFEQKSRPIADSIKVNNDAASIQGRSLLDSAQVVRLDSIILQERAGRSGRPPTPRRR